MNAALKAIPLAYATFGGSILVAQVPDIPVTTAAGALIFGFTTLLGALVWVVKRQYDTNENQQATFAAALANQQSVFAAALEKQNLMFATVIDRIRDDAQKTLKLVAKETAKE